MSRRKQSNPKPLKPSPSDDESEDGEPGDITTRRHKYKVELPPDILELQPCDQSGREVAVCAAIRLERGSSLGPFQAHVVADSESVCADSGPVIEFSDANNSPVLLKMGENGQWLALLKRKDKDSANCNIYFEGDKVWCEIRRDVLVHSELTAVFTSEPEDMTEEEKIKPATPERSDVMLEKPCASFTRLPDPVVIKAEPSSPVFSRSNSRSSLEDQPAPIHPLIFPCPFCSVRFSSPRTLDAHVQFYCSKKPSQLILSPGNHPMPPQVSPTEYREENHQTSYKGLAKSASTERLEDSRSTDSELTSRSNPASPGNEDEKSAASLLRCSRCPYSCSSMASLTRHMARIHSCTSPVLPEESRVQLAPRYMFCYDCNIQFSSISTYRGHKEYYCPKTSRQSEADGSSKQRCGKEINGNANSPEAKSASPTYRTESIPSEDGRLYSGMGGIVLPTQFLSQHIPISMGTHPAVLLAAPVLAPNGLANITMPAIIMQPVVQRPTAQSPASSQPLVPSQPSPRRCENGPSLQERAPDKRQESPKQEAEMPLDLSTKATPPKQHCREPDKSNTPERVSENTSRNDSISSSEARHRSPQRQSCSSVDSNEKVQSRSSGTSKSPSSSKGSASRPPSPKPSILPHEKQLVAPNPFLLYERLGAPFMQNHLMPNPAFVYGCVGQDLKQYDPDMNSISPHVSKCQECNIVFFKHENFVIHKKHYCASRKKHTPSLSEETTDQRARVDKTGETNESRSRTSPSDRRHEIDNGLSSERVSNRNSTESSGAQSEEDIVFYCRSCSIRFSSPDTLKAHQEFYCSELKSHGSQKRFVSAEFSTAEAMDTTKKSSQASPPKFSCLDCNNSYPSSRLLKLHFCNNNSKGNPAMLRCLYCDFVAQTENKYIDHMKAHAPSKVYRCALCGYRGNTIRGMRMHGKMHIDQGTEFTDEHLLEFEEPPQIPTSVTSTGGARPVDIEAELIRMKNEPYKRRRSRKSFEKSEYAPTARKHGRHVCPICYGIFPDSGKLSDHMQMHMSNSKYSCRSCDFCTDIKSSLIDHMRTLHGDSVVKQESQVEMNEEEQTCEKVEVKKENLSPQKVDDEMKSEKVLDCSPKYSSLQNSPEMPNALIGKVKKSPSDHSSDDSEEHPEKENVPLAQSVCPRSHSRPNAEQCDEVYSSTGSEKVGPKYCKFCDINFTFLSSFLAHKQYYCSGGHHSVVDTESLSTTAFTRQQH